MLVRADCTGVMQDRNNVGVSRRTYTGNKMIRKTAMKMIKCTHHHFLKCAPKRAPKPRFAGGKAVVVSSSVTPVLDILSCSDVSRV